MYTAYSVLLERSPLVTGFAVFPFAQNREVLEPLAGDIFCTSVGELFEDSERQTAIRITKTIINSSILILYIHIAEDSDR